ncbi:CHASE domain-containing protein [Flavobacterium aquicola]|uniref:histidine kinase n=1 Tax=Flavobacterium aquicola TaxID=1682742 RepID=A0A3E0E1L6_9FLAO|nr:CHASE domain-containing protein [Flavobacterium aquicola]REG92187.1 signal transduction histidine kinase [Flavobacterium aquicola]
MPNLLPIKKYKPFWKSLGILFTGFVITFGISNYVSQEEELQSQKEFVAVCNEAKTKISLRINLHIQFLINASSFFEASEFVTRKEWEQFNKFSTINENFTGVQGFGFAAIVKKQQLKKHIQDVRNEGFSTYTVYPSGDRPFYTSIIYLEPFNEGNARVLGFDMFTEAVRRKAMEQARDYKMPVLSGKVVLERQTQKDVQAGTLIYVPVYKGERLNTIAERRSAILGWVFSPFLMDDLMKSILGSWNLNRDENIRLRVYDNAVISQNSLLFDSHKNRISSSDTRIRTRTLPVLFNNKKWTLVFTQPLRSPFFFSAETLIIAIGGMIISLLLFALSYSLLITKQWAKSIAGRLSLDLSIKNQEYERINNSLKKHYKKLISSKEKLKEINKELQKAKVKAEESDQLKSAFLANMSHEIRTPMNGIMGFAELLKEANLSSEEQKDYIEIIEKSGTRLLNIINDIVDISKIEAGQMNVAFSGTNIDEQLQYIQTFFKPETQDKGILLLLKKTLNEDETIIQTDREKLYAILINLVKNAIKYTFKGIIEFGYVKKDDYIEFFVKDTGIGISKDRQQAIFERFIQADFNDKMARQGAGLGLSIAKAYVELLGGKIWLESEPEKGSIFYFTIPCRMHLEEDNTTAVNTAVKQENYQVEKLKILIAEDDKISRILIMKVLSSFSREILIAKTGLEAVQLCRKNPDIDLILIDMQMPQMNGYEATNKIRKFNEDVIILAQTAFALEGDKEKTIEAGCNGHISKPIKKEELSRLIQDYFGKCQKMN